jgi:hypothetical protein
MKHLLVALLVLASLAVYPASSRACFCILPELEDSFRESRSVFLGETIQITEPRTLDRDAPAVERAYTIKFKIVRSWKGVPFAASEFSILWLTNCYECLPLPRMNETYLVFATPLSEKGTWSLVTTCNRTVGVRKDSNLTNPSLDPDRAIRALDVFVTLKLDRRRG